MGDEQLFGKYRLVRRLAFGGMAEIFLARLTGDEGFEKAVVLKRILPQFSSDPDFTRMFIDEAKLAARITHPNVAQVYDFGQVDGTYFITMEHVDGTDLRKLIRTAVERGRTITPVEVAALGEAMARGLAYVHDLETDDGLPLAIVHRDISPHNVMLSRGGDLKIMDFGIAKAAARATNTATGMVKGKLAYMAPEQANGKDVDKRTDQFALGLVLWECLVGKRLFEGDSEPELLSRVAAGRVRSLREAKPDVPEPLERIIMRALKVDPDERYPDLHIMGEELGAFRYALGPAGAVRLSTLVDELSPREARPPTGPQQVSGTKPVERGSSPGSGSGGGTAVLAPEPMHTSGAVAQNPSPSDWSQSQRRTEATRAMDSESDGTEIAPRNAQPFERTRMFPDAPRPRGNRRNLLIAGGLGFILLLGGGIAAAVRFSGHTPARLTIESDPPGARIALRKDGAFVDIGMVTPAGFEAGVIGTNVTWRLEAPDYQTATGTTRLDSEKILETVKLAPNAPAVAAAQAQQPIVPIDAAKSAEPSKGIEHLDNDSRSSTKAVKRPRGEVGEVLLTVPGGWAHIYENGKELGQTGSPVAMSAGTHSLDLKFPNGAHKRVTLVVRANEQVRQKVESK